PLRSLGAVSPERLRAALDGATGLPSALAAAGAALWRLYAAPSPLGFDEARRQGVAAFPELASIAEGHAAWFPWQAGDRVTLADVDARIFECLGEDWQLGDQLLTTPSGRHIRERVFAWIGDRGVLARIEAWCAAGSIERKP